MNIKISPFPLKCYYIYFISASDTRTKWNDLLDVEKTIYRDDDDVSEHTRICVDCLSESMFKFLVKSLLYTLCFTGMCLGQHIDFFRDDMQNTVFYVRMPFKWSEHSAMNLFDISWQTFISVFGLWGLLGFELTITLCSNVITVSSRLSVWDLSQLNNELDNNLINRDQTRRKLRKIIDNIEFMDKSVEVHLFSLLKC